MERSTPQPNSNSRQGHRDWEDIPNYPDYDESVEFETSDLETTSARPTRATRLADVTDDTQAFLSSKFATRSHNNDRLDTRIAYTLPKVPETKTPTLDGFMRSEAPPQARTLDSQLQRFQSFVLDAVALLTSFVEANAKGEKVDHRKAVNAAKSAIELVGNASAQISHYRQTRLIASLNKTLLPLVDDDKSSPFTIWIKLCKTVQRPHRPGEGYEIFDERS